jgi:hypothetical protein
MATTKNNPSEEYVVALVAAKECLHAITDRLEAALDRRDERARTGREHVSDGG